MFSQDPLFWQGLSFTAIALGILGALVWWLFMSPVRQSPGEVERVSPKLAVWLAGLMGFAALQTVIGAWWDGSMHVRTGIVPGGEDFLWPPHIMIYSAFLISLWVGLIGLWAAARPAWRAGVYDPRQWARRNPYLAALAIASLYAIMSIPGDAIWHELYGLDLTAWSPPHLLLDAAMCAVVVCSIGLLLQAKSAMQKPLWVDAAVIVLMSLMLNVIYLIGVVEWEFPNTIADLVLNRPWWAYPLVGGSLALFALALTKRVVSYRWSATAMAVAFYALRLSVGYGLDLTGNLPPLMPLVFILGAILLDASALLKIDSLVGSVVVRAVAYTVGFSALSLPMLMARTDMPPYGASDVAVAVIALMVMGILLLPLARLVGARLAGSPTAAG